MQHVAIIGCGQLARLMALAGWRLGLSFSFLAQPGEATDCVKGLGEVVVAEQESDPETIFQQLGQPHVITVEKEQVPISLLQSLQRFCPVYPKPDAVAACQHRFRERRLLSKLDIPTARYHRATCAQDVGEAAKELGSPLVVKFTESGYDGRNQWHLHNKSQLQEFLQNYAGEEALIEEWVPFDREISLIAARSTSAETQCYALTENRHSGGILQCSEAPADNVSPQLRAQAQTFIGRLLDALDYVGVLAMECFQVQDKLLVNELAPRVHNSGHWTLLGCSTSQFENHLRAILGMPLGATDTHGYSGMVNILGSDQHPDTTDLVSAHATVSLYNKTNKPRRKLGHVNVRHSSRPALRAEMERIESQLFGETALSPGAELSKQARG